MKKKNNPFKLLRALLICTCVVSAMFTAAPVFSQQQEKIEHEVSVSRILIPLFAYDGSGNPVYDLKKEDIRLTINGKRVEISTINRIQFEHGTETVRKIKTKVKRYAPPQQRVVFLVIDTMFNSFYGIKRAKKILTELINHAAPGNLFVIMENSMFGGLKHLTGPTADKKKLKTALKKISRLPDKTSDSDSYDPSVRNPYARQSPRDGLTRKIERYHDKEKVKFFCNFLARLKYSLEAITQPKMVFLVSEGFSEVLFFEANPYIKEHVNYDSSPSDHIKKLVREINDGGSVLYTIYSGRIKIIKNIGGGSASGGKGTMDTGEYDFTLADANLPISQDSGINSLTAIGTGSGGRLYDDINEQIITQIEKETAAYYEISCIPSPGTKGDMRIRVKSKRKGITVNSLIRTKSGEGYAGMNKIQKKIFAINVVMGQNWALTAGNAKNGIYRWKNDDKTQFQVNIPPEMNGREVDLFLIRFQEEFQAPQITMKKLKTGEKVTIDIPSPVKNMSDYFVMIEPETTTIIYNRLK